MMHIPAIDQVFLLMLIVFCLGTCFVRAFWELEQARSHRTASSPRRDANRN